MYAALSIVRWSPVPRWPPVPTASRCHAIAVSVRSAAVLLAHSCFASAGWLPALKSCSTATCLSSSTLMPSLLPDFIAIVASVMCAW